MSILVKLFIKVYKWKVKSPNTKCSSFNCDRGAEQKSIWDFPKLYLCNIPQGVEKNSFAIFDPSWSKNVILSKHTILRQSFKMMAFLSDLDLKIIMIFLQGEIILPYPQLSLQKHNPIWPSITKWKFIPYFVIYL